MSLFIRFAKTIRHYAHLDGGWWLCLQNPANSMGNTFKDGKFIINGNVLIDGTLVK